MAGLLAQEPQVFLLDEPTNHLDPHHQVDVLLAFRERCSSGAGVIATLHDPALAERCADRVLLMYGDGRWRLGADRRTAQRGRVVAAVRDAHERTERRRTPRLHSRLATGCRRARARRAAPRAVDSLRAHP